MQELALISKAEAARRINRSPARIAGLIREGKIKPHVDRWGRQSLDEQDVEQLRCFLDQGIVRGRRPAAAAAALLNRRTNAGWVDRTPEDELPPVEPEQQPAPAAPPAPRTRSRRPSELTEDDFDLFDDNGQLDPVRCRAWQEFEKARKLQIERLAVEGKYVEAGKVQPAIERAMLTIRKGVMAVPSRMKAVFTDMSVEQVDTLERLCREALEKAIVDFEGNADS